jgi:hypothetical protein
LINTGSTLQKIRENQPFDEVIFMNIEKMKKSLFESKLRAYKNHINRLKEKYFSVNNRLQYIRVRNRKTNCLRWHNNESREHIIKKLDICRWLKEINHTFITEAIFVNGSRADVVDLSSGIIYEVLVSEKENDCTVKIKKYPEEFRVVKVNV